MFESMESCEDRLDRIQALLAERDRIDAELTAAMADAQELGAWRGAGLSSARRFLRSHGHRSRPQVRDLLSRSRLCRRHRATHAALANGTIGTGAFDAIATTVTQAHDHLYERDEALLLQAAAELTLEDFETALARWVQLADDTRDPDAGLEPFHQSLWVQQRLDGGADVLARLDEFTTTSLLAALGTFDSGPDPTGAPTSRSLSERRADALGDIADAALTSHETGAGGTKRRGPLSDTTIVIDLPALAGSADEVGAVTSVCERNGTAISADSVRAMLCDSWVSALVRDARGVVVDAVERSAPFTDTQRRLLAARDRCCVFPGCRMPPSRCDAHHRTFRRGGGRNQLANGCLLCRRHHRLIHAGWKLEPPDAAGGGWTVTSPSGRTWTQPPPRAAGARRLAR